MHQEQDYADYQDDVDEAGGNMKCEKEEEPENDEDCGDNPKHVFISLLPGAAASAKGRWHGSWFADVCGVAEECCTEMRIEGEGASGLSRYEHMGGILQDRPGGEVRRGARIKLLRVCKRRQFPGCATLTVVGEW